jgi:TIR domain-containing protein
MSSAKGYEHEVFISYATVDDRPAKCGWVSAFVSSLNESLAAAFGVRDPHRIWWDRPNIDEEASLTEQIRTRAQKSACMVVILSQGYSKSKWCRQEREAFLAAVAGQPEADRRLFLIDIGNLDQQDRPQEFSDKRGRYFYVQPPNTTSITDREPLGFPTPDPENKDHKAFFSQIDQLARDLYERISKLSETETVASPNVAMISFASDSVIKRPGALTVAPSLKPNSDVTLFVAESADDVAEEREEVVRFLSDHFHVLPAIDDPLPNRWDQWQASVDAGLKASTLFVQVLGVLPGRKIAGSEQKPVIAQFERAQAAGKRAILWRSQAFSPASVCDSRMKELLSAAEYCGPLEEFKSEIKRLAATPPLAKAIERPVFADGEERPIVFIQAGIEDAEQAQLLSDLLTEMNCFPMVPMTDGDPDVLRRDLEANLTECDGLVLVYGHITPTWVRQQFRSLPKVLSQRMKLDPPRPLRGLAICKGEPPGKPDPGVNTKGLQWFDATAGLKPDELRAWLVSLQMGGAL